MKFELHTYAPELNKAYYPNGKIVKGFVPSGKASALHSRFELATKEYQEWREKKRNKVEATHWKLAYRKGCLKREHIYHGKPEDTFVSIHKTLRELGCKDIKVKLA